VGLLKNGENHCQLTLDVSVKKAIHSRQKIIGMEMQKCALIYIAVLNY